MNWWTLIVAVVASSTKTTTTVAESAIKRLACKNGYLTLYCEADRRVNSIQDVEWRIKFLGTGWIKFSSCSYKSGVINCFAHRAILADGITLLNNSNGAVTIKRSGNATHDQARIMCQVHYFDSLTPSRRDYEVNFTTQCVRIQEGRDLNLTKILLMNFLYGECERVVDIEWYSANGNKFTYCGSCQVCIITNDSKHPVPVFWNRLQVRRGSLLLTEIHGSDNNRKIIVKVHMKTLTELAKRDINANMEEPRVYAIRIFVDSGHLDGSQGLKLALPIAPPTTRTDRSSLPSSSHAGSPKKSSGYSANGQEWTVVVMVSAVFLGIVFGS